MVYNGPEALFGNLIKGEVLKSKRVNNARLKLVFPHLFHVHL
jgi:hypothetical protein